MRWASLVTVCSKSRAPPRQRQSARLAATVELDQKPLPRHPPPRLSLPRLLPLLPVRRARLFHVRINRSVISVVSDETHASSGVEAPAALLLPRIPRYQDWRNHRLVVCGESSRVWVVEGSQELTPATTQLLNKVAGVYGLVAVLTGAGGSLAQLSLYIYSVLGLIALVWGLKAILHVCGTVHLPSQATANALCRRILSSHSTLHTSSSLITSSPRHGLCSLRWYGGSTLLMTAVCKPIRRLRRRSWRVVPVTT